MIDGTLIDLVDCLIFEAMILAILGHLNLYIPKEQKLEIEKYHEDNEWNDEFVIKMHTYVNEKWFLVLAAIALIILWGRFLEANFETAVLEVTDSSLLYTVVTISLIIFVFIISALVLVVAPFFGEMRKIRYYKKYYSHTFGIAADI